MALNLAGGVKAYEQMIDNFAKTITRTPVTKTVSNIEGDETLTEGTAVSISGALFRKEDIWNQDFIGLLQNADAILMVKSSVTINKDDKLIYDSENYRVQSVVTRRLGTSAFYKVAQCYKI